MTDRSVTVRFKADIADLRKQMGAASKSIEGVAASSRKASADATASQKKTAAALKANSADIDRLGSQMLLVGGLGVAALGLTAKAAVDWESAWAGVTKTVSGTPAQLASIEGGLRDLAKALPSTHSEIAAVAEAAGALGVKTKDIVAFTKTMIDLGETTNLSADEAATSIAQISNVMGTLDREGAAGVRKFGSALVALGNDGASTERDIVNMASRIAGAGKVVGLTEQDLLAVSSALSSVGVEAEAGGTAVSKVLIDMSKAISTGADELDLFAKVAGLSADQFAKKFQGSPAEALAAFTTGLGRMQASGQDVFTTLDDLGQSDVRVSTSLLKMAGAGDLLTDSLATSRTAWEQNNALTEEAAKRYDTTAAKLEIARNAIVDAAVEFGSVVVPVLADLAEGLADVAGWAASLPGPVKTLGVAMGAAATAALLLGGAGIKAVIALAEMEAGLKAAGIATTGFTAKTLAAARAVGIIGAAAAGLGIAGSTMQTFWQDIEGGSDDATKSLEAYIAQGGEAEGVTLLMSRGFDDLADVVNNAFSPEVGHKISAFASEVGTAFGIFGPTSTDDAISFFNQLDEGLSGLVKGGKGDEAARLFRQIAEEAKAQGYSLEQVKEVLPQYAAALDVASASAETSSIPTLTDDLDANANGWIDATEALQGWIDELNDAATPILDQREARNQLAEAQRAATRTLALNGKALDKNGDALTTHNRKSIENRRALDDVADAHRGVITTMKANGASQGELNTALASSRVSLEKTAVKFGLTRGEARKYVDQVLKVPAARETKISLQAQQARDDLREFSRAMTNLPSSKTVTVQVRYRGQLKDPTGAANGLMTDYARGRVSYRAQGGMDVHGATVARVPQIVNGGNRQIMWAEDPAQRWEAYISGMPGQEGRNRQIWVEAGRRLGVDQNMLRTMRFANGGMTGNTPAAAAPARASYGSLVNVENITAANPQDAIRALSYAARRGAVRMGLSGVGI